MLGYSISNYCNNDTEKPVLYPDCYKIKYSKLDLVPYTKLLGRWVLGFVQNIETGKIS